MLDRYYILQNTTVMIYLYEIYVNRKLYVCMYTPCTLGVHCIILESDSTKFQLKMRKHAEILDQSREPI